MATTNTPKHMPVSRGPSYGAQIKLSWQKQDILIET